VLNPADLLLYLCTDFSLSLGRPLNEAVEAAIAGGITLVQVREKTASSRDFYRLALQAEAEGADYLGVGAVYPTGSKTDAGEAIGIEGLAKIRAAVRLPLVAIGGIHAGNALQIMDAGASGIALISGILSQVDIEAATRNIRRMLESRRRKG
jgi:thiamine monophosphate synthase